MTDLAALRLHVRYDEGTGPLFVLLHGINADAQDWRAVIDQIGGGYRFIAVDLLGFGESPKPVDIDYTADEHAAVLEATLDDLGIAEQFVLVGYSLGGDIAIRYAAKHPERIRRLFLLSTPFYLPADEYARKKFGTQFFEGMFYQGLWSAVARQKKREGVVYELASGRLEEFAKAFLRTDDVSEHWDIMSRNLTNTIAAATFVDDLPHLSMPTVFALGVRDPIVRPDQTIALKRLKPDIEIRRIPGLTADHFMLMNIPERVAVEIVRDEVDSLHLAFHAGTGEPVVLLHGIESSSGRWLPVAEALAKANEVAVVDLLGFGSSPAPLSSRYTLEDHSAAVLGTLRKRFAGRRVRLVGHGFGAVVALECAATRPEAIKDVVGFGPVLLPPGESLEDRALDPVAAGVLATRDSLREMAANERAQSVSSEQLERRAVPALRSLDALLSTDAAALMRRVRVPVRFVLAEDDTLAPREWLVSLCASQPQRFEVLTPRGGHNLPFERPVDAVAAIGPVAESQLYAASIAKPSHAERRDSLLGLLGGVNAQLVRRGLLMLAAGLLLLLLPIRIPPQLVTTALALWLLVESAQVVIGSVALRRNGKSWLPWLLLGVVSVLFAIALTLRDAFAAWVLAFAIGVWAFVRGVANLVVAWRAPETPGRRWALVLEGLLGIGIATAIFIAPEFGGRLVRWTLGGYLAASGAISLTFAYSTHRATRRRIREYLEQG